MTYARKEKLSIEEMEQLPVGSQFLLYDHGIEILCTLSKCEDEQFTFFHNGTGTPNPTTFDFHVLREKKYEFYGVATEPTGRPMAPGLEEILYKTFPVLDKGFLRVVDYAGNDQSVVRAARTSYGNGTRKVSDDRALLRYLVRNLHTTPLEFCQIHLHMRIPLDAQRQAVRHRTSSINEYSTRYSVAIDECQQTQPDRWRYQSKSNKQGSGDFLPQEMGVLLTEEEEKLQNYARKVYEARLDLGVAREQARKDLPLSNYTELYWSWDLHNLLHFLFLRMDSHAQEEIRAYANVIGNEFVARWVPMLWEAFQDYRLNAMKLSSIETETIRLIQTDQEQAVGYLKGQGLLEEGKGGKWKRNRERDELEVKLQKLGIKVPWHD